MKGRCFATLSLVAMVVVLLMPLWWWNNWRWNNLRFSTTRGPNHTFLTIPPPTKAAPLARPAPLLRDVKEQKKAGETLHRMLAVDHVQYNCSDAQKLEGGRRHYCRDKGFTVTPPCLVYSFGINYDFGFDDSFAQVGCDIFSFDPSMNTPDHRRSQRVMFYQIGLGGADSDSFVPRLDSYVKRKTTWKMRTLKTLMAMLNHTDRTIDVLKIDIECSEWGAVRNILDTGVFRQVKQLLVEWHIFPNCPPRERFQQLITLLEDLETAGFKLFQKHPEGKTNLQWKKFNVQSEDGYVNLRFKKH